MKKALITGITGQDGSYLAELLLSKGYQVHGIVLRSEIEDPERAMARLSGVAQEIVLHVGSIESYPSLHSIIEKVAPDECYHLAASSFVSYSFDEEFSVFNTNIGGTHNVLSALKNAAPQCHFYFAGSSPVRLTLTTPLTPSIFLSISLNCANPLVSNVKYIVTR